MDTCYHEGYQFSLGEITPGTRLRPIYRTPFLEPNKVPGESVYGAASHLWEDLNMQGKLTLYCLGQGPCGPQVWKYSGNSWIVDSDCDNQHLTIPVQMMCQYLYFMC